MADLRTAHTADLDAVDRRVIRRLLDDAYGGDFDDADWDHALGGLHILVTQLDELVGHAAVVQRRVWHRDVSIRTGYLEALAVRADHRREGIARTAMTEVERIIRAGYDLGALSDGTNIEDFYQRRGWLTWRGPTAVVGPTGVRRTADEDGTLLVLLTPTTPQLDLTDAIACDWRSGDVW